MKVEKINRTNNLRAIVSDLIAGNGSIVRAKDFFALAEAQGIAKKDTYFLFPENARDHGNRGYYRLAKMLEIANDRLAKLEGKAPTKKVKAPAAPKSRIVKKSMLEEATSGSEASFNYAPTYASEADIAEELELMGTHL